MVELVVGSCAAVVLVVGPAIGDEEENGREVVVFWMPLLPHLITSDMSDGIEYTTVSSFLLMHVSYAFLSPHLSLHPSVMFTQQLP